MQPHLLGPRTLSGFVSLCLKMGALIARSAAPVLRTANLKIHEPHNAMEPTEDMFCTLMATILGAIHGSTMPMAFFFLSDLYHAVYMPNDDGSLPPVNAPHTIRDSKVTEVGMTYILLALVVLCARTGGCYLAIHSADRQVVRARRQYFQQILMQGPSWHDLHHANELAPQLVQDTHLFRDGIGERLVDFSRAVAMAMSASVT